MHTTKLINFGLAIGFVKYTIPKIFIDKSFLIVFNRIRNRRMQAPQVFLLKFPKVPRSLTDKSLLNRFSRRGGVDGDMDNAFSLYE